MDNTDEENLYYLRHHLLSAANYACRLAIQWGDGVESPDPKMASVAGRIWDIAEEQCPPQDAWPKGGADIIDLQTWRARRA